MSHIELLGCLKAIYSLVIKAQVFGVNVICLQIGTPLLLRIALTCNQVICLKVIVQAALSKFVLPCVFWGKSDLNSFSRGNLHVV